MTYKRFSQKDPAEVLQYSFDFSKIITTAAETISSQTWTITPIHPGVDAAASDMILVGQASINGKICSQFIQLGVSGVNYLVSCQIVTNEAQTIKLVGVLPVLTFS